MSSPHNNGKSRGSDGAQHAARRMTANRRKTWRWVLPPVVPDAQVQAIADRFGVHPIVGRVLAARGWEPDNGLGDFLSPLLSQTHNPMLINGMETAVERLCRAVEEREPVLVYGDYDVDGITATSVLVNVFRLLNVPVDYYVPSRLKEGYGLHIEALKEVSKTFRLIVTVDTGITAVEEADWARRHGIDLIVTDHHRPGETLPEALALVNPNQPGCPYPDKNLAGVGVAFKLAHALLKGSGHDPEESREFLRNQLDLVALGTICDLVPLIGENRAFVRHGLDVLGRAERPGFKALKVVCGFEYDKRVSTHHIGYGLGPRLNAAGRTDSPSLAVDLLITEDESQAFKMAEQLEQLNDQRRKIERTIVDEAMKKIQIDCDMENDRVIVCGGVGWHLGVIGIVASRLLDRYHRPTIVCNIDNGMAKGSGRSIQAFDLHSALGQCSEHLIQFGGHAHAAGVRLESDKIDALRAELNRLAADNLADEDMVPKLRLDAEIRACEVEMAGVESMKKLAPHGHKNSPPLFYLKDVSLASQPRVVGRNHLKLFLRGVDGSPVEAIGFNQADALPKLLESDGRIELAGVPKENEFRGVRTVQFEIKDLRLAE